jgi:hypothetical protein
VDKGAQGHGSVSVNEIQRLRISDWSGSQQVSGEQLILA